MQALICGQGCEAISFNLLTREQPRHRRREGRSRRREENLEREALQRAHPDHGLHVGTESGQIEKADVVAGKVEAARPGEVDE